MTVKPSFTFGGSYERRETHGFSPLPLFLRIAGVVGVVMGFSTGAAMAQAFPTKSVRMVIPFPPGGTTDILGRVAAQKLTEALGQQVVPDNRPGAAGNIGTEQVAKAP